MGPGKQPWHVSGYFSVEEKAERGRGEGTRRRGLGRTPDTAWASMGPLWAPRWGCPEWGWGQRASLEMMADHRWAVVQGALGLHHGLLRGLGRTEWWLDPGQVEGWGCR